MSEAGPPRKLLASPSMKLRIGAACIALLILGAWLRPRTAAPMTPPEERPAPLLEEQVQQRAVPAFRGIEDAVARLPVRGLAVRPHAGRAGVASDFRIAIAPGPAVYAVTVSDSHVLTHAAALSSGAPAAIVTADGTAMPTSLAAFDTATGMVLLSTTSPAGPTPIFAESAAQPGALVVAAARTPTQDVAIPLFITSVTAERYGVGGFGAGPAPGLPIYNLDGGLLAVSAGDGTAWRIRHALDRLLSQAATGVLPSSIGVAFQIIDSGLADAFGTTGLAIVDVAPGGPADVAGVEVGDVIVGVGDSTSAGGAGLPSTLDALPAGTTVQLTLRRGRRNVVVNVTPAFEHDVAALAPQRAAVPGPVARALFDDDALTAAAVPGNAVVIMVNGRSLGPDPQAAEEMRKIEDAMLVLFEHRGQRFFARVGQSR